MKRIKERAARLRRFPRGRGFGVQSPNDYNFITKVVKGHIDSCCCAAIDAENADVRGDKYKFVHLCYRVAQYLKPACCICLTPHNDNTDVYVSSAVDGITVTHSYESNVCAGRCLMILSPAADFCDRVEHMLSGASDNMWIIVDGIRSSAETYRAWKIVTADRRTRITFDLYHYGIVCFDKKRYKQNYKIYL